MKNEDPRFWDGVFASVMFVVAIALVFIYWILSGGSND